MGWANRSIALGYILATVKDHGEVRMGYTPDGDRRFYAVPFGVVLPNYGTFGKSVFDPNSSLVRVLRWLRNTPIGASTTKRDICEGVFDFVIGRNGKTLRYNPKLERWYPVNLSGWRSPWFAGIRKAGFVEKSGKNFVLTPLGMQVLNFHEGTDW